MDLALASLKKVSATGLVPRAAQLLSEWMRQQRIAVDMINIIVRHGAAASASHIGGGTLPRAKFTSKVPLEVDLVPLKNRVAKNQHGLMGLPKVGLFEKDVEKPYEHGKNYTDPVSLLPRQTPACVISQIWPTNSLS